MAQHASATERRRPSRPVVVTGVVVVSALAAVGVFIGLETSSPARGAHGHGATSSRHSSTSTSTPGLSAPGSAPPSSSTTTSAPAAVPGPAGPGFVAGHVTAVGDSVMLDYQDALKAAIPGINVDAAVSRQWSDGETVLQSMKASGQLGALVIVGLGTNGPITDSDFDTMMSILGGAVAGRLRQCARRPPLAGFEQRGPGKRRHALSQRGHRQLGVGRVAKSTVVRGGRHASRDRWAGRRRARHTGGDHAGQRMRRKMRHLPAWPARESPV